VHVYHNRSANVEQTQYRIRKTHYLRFLTSSETLDRISRRRKGGTLILQGRRGASAVRRGVHVAADIERVAGREARDVDGVAEGMALAAAIRRPAGHGGATAGGSTAIEEFDRLGECASGEQESGGEEQQFHSVVRVLNHVGSRNSRNRRLTMQMELKGFWEFSGYVASGVCSSRKWQSNQDLTEEIC